MALFSLGSVTVAAAGTPERVTKNESVPALRFPAHSFMVEVLTTNTGKVYVGSVTMNKATLAGVYAVIPPPSINIFGTFTSTISYAPAGFNLAEVFLDVDVNGEGALVSCIKA